MLERILAVLRYLLYLRTARRLLQLLRYHTIASSDDREVAEAILNSRPASVALDKTPRISALVAAWNPEEDLERLVASFRAIDYADKELILAVGGAHRLESLRHLEGDGVRLIAHPGGAKQNALRACYREATGNILFLTDADCSIESEGFLRLIAPIVHGETSVTTGRHIPFAEQQRHPFVRLQWASSTYSFAHVSPDPGVFGSNCALTRKAVEAAGRFEERVVAGTDVHLSARLREAGYHVRYVYESRVQTNYHRRLGPYLRQYSRWLRSHAFNAQLAGDSAGVRAWRRESLEAVSFLALTALLPLRRPLLVCLIIVPAVERYLSWLRLLRFTQCLERNRWRVIDYLRPLPILYAEVVARVMALVDHLVPSRRFRW